MSRCCLLVRRGVCLLVDTDTVLAPDLVLDTEDSVLLPLLPLGDRVRSQRLLELALTPRPRCCGRRQLRPVASLGSERSRGLSVLASAAGRVSCPGSVLSAAASNAAAAEE